MFGVSRAKASISEPCRGRWSIAAWPGIDPALTRLAAPGDKSGEIKSTPSSRLSLKSCNNCPATPCLRPSFIFTIAYVSEIFWLFSFQDRLNLFRWRLLQGQLYTWEEIREGKDPLRWDSQPFFYPWPQNHLLFPYFMLYLFVAHPRMLYSYSDQKKKNPFRPNFFLYYIYLYISALMPFKLSWISIMCVFNNLTCMNTHLDGIAAPLRSPMVKANGICLLENPNLNKKG